MTLWYDDRRVTAGIAPPKIGEDAEAVAAIARGDADALTLAYRQHHVAVRAFACRLLGDHAAAEDLVQEVFVTLPVAAARFESRSTLRSFVIAIAVNHSKHFVRAAARRRAAMKGLGFEPISTVPTPDARFEQEQLAEALFRGLDQLRLDERVAFVLCEIEERSSAEAAEIVGAPPPTVRARLQAAKRRLRELLGEKGFR